MQLYIPLFFLFSLTVSSKPIDQQQNHIRTRNNPEELGEKFEGDIVLPPATNGRGVAIRPASVQRWASGVVPYVFESNITFNHTELIVSMMREMERLTAVNGRRCISFREKTASDPYFITIFNGTGCYAPVGSWGNATVVRPVSLLNSPTATCMISGIIQHELAHVLGFFHEQSRPDRDDYVQIQWSNIQTGTEDNFAKYANTQVDTLTTSYDYGSVMHYDSYAFAVNRSVPTIIPIRNSSAVLGQRIQLSRIDILEIQRYYDCVPISSGSRALRSFFQSTSMGCMIVLCSTTFFLNQLQ